MSRDLSYSLLRIHRCWTYQNEEKFELIMNEDEAEQ